MSGRATRWTGMPAPSKPSATRAATASSLGRLDDQAALDLGQGGQQRAHVVGQPAADVGVVGAADRGDEDARAVGRQRRQPGELGQHLARDRVRAAAVGVDGEDGQVLVDRQPLFVQVVEVGAVQHRAVLVALDPGHGLVVADPEVDDAGVAEHGAGPRVLDGAAAERDHRLLAADELGHRRVLELAEVGLALGDEDVADVAAEALLDQHVAVHERLARAVRRRCARPWSCRPP